MTPEDWHTVKELCHLTLERPPDERMAFLAQACSDERIRQEVWALLAHATEGAGILDVPVWTNVPPPESPQRLDATVSCS